MATKIITLQGDYPKVPTSAVTTVKASFTKTDKIVVSNTSNYTDVSTYQATFSQSDYQVVMNDYCFTPVKLRTFTDSVSAITDDSIVFHVSKDISDYANTQDSITYVLDYHLSDVGNTRDIGEYVTDYVDPSYAVDLADYNLTGSIKFSVSKPFYETLSTADSVAVHIHKTLSDSVTVTDALNTAYTIDVEDLVYSNQASADDVFLFEMHMRINNTSQSIVEQDFLLSNGDSFAFSDTLLLSVSDYSQDAVIASDVLSVSSSIVKSDNASISETAFLLHAQPLKKDNATTSETRLLITEQDYMSMDYYDGTYDLYVGTIHNII